MYKYVYVIRRVLEWTPEEWESFFHVLYIVWGIILVLGVVAMIHSAIESKKNRYSVAMIDEEHTQKYLLKKRLTRKARRKRELLSVALGCSMVLFWALYSTAAELFVMTKVGGYFFVLLVSVGIGVMIVSKGKIFNESLKWKAKYLIDADLPIAGGLGGSPKYAIEILDPDAIRETEETALMCLWDINEWQMISSGYSVAPTTIDGRLYDVVTVELSIQVDFTTSTQESRKIYFLLPSGARQIPN